MNRQERRAMNAEASRFWKTAMLYTPQETTINLVGTEAATKLLVPIMRAFVGTGAVQDQDIEAFGLVDGSLLTKDEIEGVASWPDDKVLEAFNSVISTGLLSLRIKFLDDKIQAALGFHDPDGRLMMRSTIYEFFPSGTVH